MTIQSRNAIARYRRDLEKALAAAPPDIRSEAIQDADEFLNDAVHAMDVGRLSSESAAYDRFVERFGTPNQLAADYLGQCDTVVAGRLVGAGSILASDPHAMKSRSAGWARFAALIVVAMIMTSVCYATLREPPKLSPFTEVQFEGDKVFVTYDGRDYEWLGLDKLSVDDILTGAKKQFGDRWQKRVAEDLVEVLWGMDHRPSDTVQLRLVDPVTGAQQVVAAADMTEENRRSIYRKRRDAGDRDQSDSDQPPKLSPFTEVRFSDEEVLVTFKGRDYRWLELDHLTVEEIVSAAKKQFGDRWQKRVAEDLVEVLWGMEVRPEETVRLRLVDPQTNNERVVEKAELTKENRLSLYLKRMAAE